MATFKIHEDDNNINALKENAGLTRNNIDVKDAALKQRKTLSVLNNIQLGARAHAQKTVIIIIIFFYHFLHNLLTQHCGQFLFFSISCDLLGIT